MAPKTGISHFLPGESRQPVASAIDYSELTKPEVRYELFNPDPDEPVIFSYMAEQYTIPPSGQCLQTRHPFSLAITTYDKPGVCPISDRLERAQHPVPAKRIIQYVVGEDGRSGEYGRLGVRALFGDQRDEQVKKEAYAAWTVNRDQEAALRTRAHEAAVAQARDAGDVPPRPSTQIQKDYEWLASRAGDIEFRFACEVCNSGFRKETEMLAHAASIHRKTPFGLAAVEKLGLDQPSTKLPFVPPVSRGRIPTAEEIEASLREAESLYAADTEEEEEEEPIPDGAPVPGITEPPVPPTAPDPAPPAPAPGGVQTQSKAAPIPPKSAAKK